MIYLISRVLAFHPYGIQGNVFVCLPSIAGRIFCFIKIPTAKGISFFCRSRKLYFFTVSNSFACNITYAAVSIISNCVLVSFPICHVLSVAKRTLFNSNRILNVIYISSAPAHESISLACRVVEFNVACISGVICGIVSRTTTEVVGNRVLCLAPCRYKSYISVYLPFARNIKLLFSVIPAVKSTAELCGSFKFKCFTVSNGRRFCITLAAAKIISNRIFIGFPICYVTSVARRTALDNEICLCFRQTGSAPAHESITLLCGVRNCNLAAKACILTWDICNLTAAKIVRY